MLVGEYIRAAAGRRWLWNSHDCCTFVASWVMLCGHRDPMRLDRGTYDSEMSALRRIAEGGGLQALWGRGMADAGVLEIDPAETLAAGDVGVIARPTTCSTDEATAIYTGERWATLGLRGIDVAPAVALRVWRP